MHKICITFILKLILLNENSVYLRRKGVIKVNFDIIIQPYINFTFLSLTESSFKLPMTFSSCNFKDENYDSDILIVSEILCLIYFSARGNVFEEE